MDQQVAVIQGERVRLRPPEESDLEEWLRVWTPELRHMYGGSLTSPARPKLEGRKGWVERVRRGEEGHCFAVEAEGRYIGFATVKVTEEESRRGRYRIGIENPEYWGRGYGSEVTRLMLRHAFETLGLHRVDLRVAAYNTRAIRCYEKCGFRLEGIERDSFFVDGQWHDDWLMAVLRGEWEELGRADAPGCEEVRIRDYRNADHARVIALWEEAGFTLRASDGAEVLARKLVTEKGPVLVAEVEGEIVGTVMGHTDRLWSWVSRLAVKPTHRRRGIARLLMREAERRLVELGAQRVCLLTHRENEVALGLYRGLGYETWDDIVVVSRVLVSREEKAHGG